MRFKKSTFWVKKRSTFGGFRTFPDLILAWGLHKTVIGLSKIEHFLFGMANIHCSEFCLFRADLSIQYLWDPSPQLYIHQKLFTLCTY